MANIRRGRSSFGRGKKRQTDWGLHIFSTGFATIANNSKVLAAGTLFSSLVTSFPATIVRTRGQVVFASDQVAGAESPMMALGIQVVSNVAFGLGITAISGPLTNAVDDAWFVLQALQHRFEGTGQGPVYRSIEIDSKAMRKVEPTDAPAIVFENGAAVGGLVAFNLRFLFKAG